MSQPGESRSDLLPEGHTASPLDASDNLPTVEPEPFIIGDAGRSYGEILGGVPFATPAPADTVCDAFDFHRWSVRAASVRGLQHRHGGTVRQDTYQVQYSAGTDRLVAVACDGVGSAALSHIAADIAATALVAAVLHTEKVPSGADDWLAVFAAASDQINVQQGNLADDPHRAMATTAVIAVIERTRDSGPWHMTCAGVGDSSIWVVGAQQTSWLRVLGGKDSDDPVQTNVVSALPFRRAEGSVLVEQRSLSPRSRVLLCTDGVGDTFGAGGSEVATTFREAWATPPRALNFAAHIGFGKRSFIDDRTGVAIWAPTA